MTTYQDAIRILETFDEPKAQEYAALLRSRLSSDVEVLARRIYEWQSSTQFAPIWGELATEKRTKFIHAASLPTSERLALGYKTYEEMQADYASLPQPQDIRNDALETAARVCDGVNNHDNPMTASDCADAIRAMKSQPSAPHPARREEAERNIKTDLIDANMRGVCPPQNWTHRAVDEISRLERKIAALSSSQPPAAPEQVAERRQDDLCDLIEEIVDACYEDGAYIASSSNGKSRDPDGLLAKKIQKLKHRVTALSQPSKPAAVTGGEIRLAVWAITEPGYYARSEGHTLEYPGVHDVIADQLNDFGIALVRYLERKKA